MSQAAPAPELFLAPDIEPRQRVKDTTNLKQTLNAISAQMKTKLSEKTLDLCLDLLEDGVCPKALANVVLQAREINGAINDT